MRIHTRDVRGHYAVFSSYGPHMTYSSETERDINGHAMQYFVMAKQGMTVCKFTW